MDLISFLAIKSWWSDPAASHDYSKPWLILRGDHYDSSWLIRKWASKEKSMTNQSWFGFVGLVTNYKIHHDTE